MIEAALSFRGRGCLTQIEHSCSICGGNRPSGPDAADRIPPALDTMGHQPVNRLSWCSLTAVWRGQNGDFYFIGGHASWRWSGLFVPQKSHTPFSFLPRGDIIDEVKEHALRCRVPHRPSRSMIKRQSIRFSSAPNGRGELKNTLQSFSRADEGQRRLGVAACWLASMNLLLPKKPGKTLFP